MNRPLPSFTIHLSGDHFDKQTVPASPTVAMLEAAIHALDGVNLSKYRKKDRALIKAAVRYQAMLKVAPKL